MTEHDTALRFDQALDGQPGIELDGSESLLTIARILQSGFDRQRAIPSEEFIMQLETTLFPTVVIPSAPPVIPSATEKPPAPPVIPSAAEGSPAAAVPRPQPTPRSAPTHPKRTRTPHRWVVAIAAALILLLGGAGSIIFGPLHPHPTPQPSAIPAVSFGTVEASPESAGGIWTVSPPQGVQGASGPAFIEDGLMYSILNGPSGPYAQVIDIATVRALWSSRLAVSADLTASVWRGLLLFTGTGGPNYELFAFDGRTGKERWSIPFAQRPVSLIVDGDRAFILGSGNLVVAIDLETQQELWQTDLSAFDPDWEPYGGMNRYSYFNDGRLALSNGVLAVLISNGQLIALDAEDGSQEWTAGYADDGRATVYVSAGQFVITAEGKSIFDMDEDPYLRPPSPVPSYDPKTQPCERTVEPLSATDSSALDDYQTSATALDPITGKPSWKVRTQAAVWIAATDDSHLVAIIRPGWDPAIGNEDFAIYCAIDGETGNVARISDVELATFTYGVSRTDEPWSMGVVPSGVPLGTGHLSPEVAKELPHFGFDPETFTGFRWVQKADGLILITEQNGTITGFPENAPAVVTLDATPALATPVADTSWIVPGPAGTHAESEATWPVVANGQIFRSFYTATADYHTQAVDMMTGAVLWDKPLDVRGEVMASSGDRLLVGGRENGMLKDFSLVALDQTSGNEIWRAVLPELPIAIAVDGDRGYVLGLNNQLDAVDLSAGMSIYTTDIGGNSKPVDSAIPIGSQHRMVIDGNVMVAVLADGSVAGVDAETGKGTWWNLRKGTGSVQVKSIADALIVIDFGDTSFYLPEESRNADGLATLVVVATPTVATCLDNLSAASPVATPAPRIAPNFRTTLTRIKPETGAVLWTVRDPGTFISVLTSDTDMIYLVSTAEEWPTDRSQTAICAIDLRTGRSSEIGSLSGMIDSTFLLTTPDYPDQVLVAGRLDSGEMTAFPSIFDPAVTGPKISIELGKGEGTYWIGIYDNAIYLSRMDGQLEKIPIPAR